MNMNSKQVTLHFCEVGNENTSSFEENTNKNACFIFIPLLIAISCFSFNRSNEIDHVPM